MTLKLRADLNGVYANTRAGKRREVAKAAMADIPPDIFFVKEEIIGSSFPSTRKPGELVCITKDHYEAGMQTLFRTPAFRSTPRMCGMREAHENLTKIWDIAIVSNVVGLPDDLAWGWFEEQDVVISDIFMTRGKPKTKHYSDCHAVIDDEVKHLEPILGKGPIPILFIPPPEVCGGRKLLPPPKLDRRIRVAHGWEEVEQILNEAAEQVAKAA